jgi:hypothetical protein
MQILRRAAAIVCALIVLLVSWAITMWILVSIPGTPHFQIPEVVNATFNARSDAGLRAFLEHGERLKAWNAILLSLVGGLAVGLVSRRWLKLRSLEIAFVVLAVVLFKWADYKPCCVTVWDFVGPALLGAAIFLVVRWRRSFEAT